MRIGKSSGWLNESVSLEYEHVSPPTRPRDTRRRPRAAGGGGLAHLHRRLAVGYAEDTPRTGARSPAPRRSPPVAPASAPPAPSLVPEPAMPVSLPVVSSPRFSAGSSAAITDPFPSIPPTPVLYAMARELEALSDATWQPAVPLPAEPPTDARRGNTVFDEASASSPVIASACPQAFASPPRAPRSARARRARTGGDAWPAPTFLSRPSSSRIGRGVFGKLVALGYSREQIRKLKQESLSEIAKYHTTLTGQGFTHADICRISRRRQSLRVVARNYPELAAALPELTRAHIVDIARQRSGDLALQALLPVATALTAAP